MDETFEKTVSNASRFTTYTLGIAALVKTIKVLQDRGADEKAISFILTGMDLLIKQLEDAAQKLENKQVVEKFLAELKNEHGIP